jgi:arylsulfate sulfotransferase
MKLRIQSLILITTTALLCSCGIPNGLEFIAAPTIVPNPNEAAPLAAILTFESDRPVKTTIKVFDGELERSVHYDESHDPSDGLTVIGFSPNKTHKVTVLIEDAQGNFAQSKPLDFKAPGLPSHPAEFPEIQVAHVDHKRAESGYRLFNPRRRIPRETQLGNEQELRFGESFGMLTMVDLQGNPFWYYQTESRIAGFNYQEDGRIFYVTADYHLVEIDLLGNVTRSWYAERRPQGPSEATPVDALTFHHDADLLDNGNIIALSTEKRLISNYYTSEYDAKAPRKDQWVMGDRLVELTPDGKIVWEWNAFDHMPTSRIGYETFSTYWERRGFPGVIDWSHANEITKLEDGNVLVNFRYQSAVLKIDANTGEIIWIFGEPSGWPESLQSKLFRLEGDTRWPWHQHAPQFTKEGTFVMFDNGNYRSHPFNLPTPVKDTWSRAIEYELDEENLVARQIWTSEYPGHEKFVTIAMGNASVTAEKGNVLAGYGAILDPERVHEVDWKTRARIGQVTRCIEYTKTSPAEIVWELRLEPTGDDPKIGWNIFGCKSIKELSF